MLREGTEDGGWRKAESGEGVDDLRLDEKRVESRISTRKNRKVESGAEHELADGVCGNGLH
jgi:hypothetical protein